jgi:hypothetical protein
MKKSIYSDTNEIFVEWLKQAREDKNLSLRNVGEIIGRHHSIIGNVETKVRRMDVAEFIVYCEEIGLDPHDAIEYIQRKRKLANLGNQK